MEENDVNVNTNTNKKNAVIGLVAIVIVVLVVALGVSLFLPSPKKVIKNYCKYLSDGEYDKVVDLMDFEGMTVLAQLDEDEYEDFDDELKDFKDSDEYEDFEEELEDVKDTTAEAIETAYDFFDEIDMEVKEIKESKKVKGTKSLYKVKAKIKVTAEYDGDEEEDATTATFYVSKKGLKYYIVGAEDFGV